MTKCSPNEDKLWGIFDKRPLIWFHYVLLVGVLYGSWFIGDLLYKSQMLRFYEWYIMLPWIFVFLSIGDQLIHKFLRVD